MERLTFGIFLVPFHRLGENPTLALERDLDLLRWLDHLGYDEAWIGEHHSAGWETIAAPEVFMATAAERTRHLRLGPGALSADAHMLGIAPARQREMMDESLTIIKRLLTETDPITYKTDWFELRDALLHLRPCTQPPLPIVRGVVALPEQRKIAEESAARHGNTMDRQGWRLVMPIYLAESCQQALDEARHGAAAWLQE